MAADSLRPVLAFAACCLIWGTTWLGIKVGYADLGPLWAAALRFVIAAGVFAALATLRRSRWSPKRSEVFGIALVGIVFFGGEYGFLYWGEQFLPSALTAVVFSTTPIFAGLFGLLLGRAERWTGRQAVGSAVGILGVAVMSAGDLRGTPGSLAGMAAILASAASAAMGSVLGRRYTRDVPVLVLNAGAMLVGSLVLFGGALSRGETIGLPSTRVGWFSVLYLALAGSVVAFFLYFWLLRTWPAHRATLVTLVVPVVAFVVGVFLGGETYGAWGLLGSGIVLAGVTTALWPTGVPARGPA